MSKFKILYLITGLRLGGAEKQLMLLAEHMQLSGAKVLVVAMESGGALASQFVSKGIAVDSLDISGFKSLLNGYNRFKKLVERFSPDIVHSHMIHANLFAMVYKILSGKIRLITTAHNIKEGNAMFMAGYYLTKKIANWSTNVSREAFDFYVAKKYFERGKSSYLPNAIDTEYFKPIGYDSKVLRNQLGITENAFVYFTAGRLHEQKNHSMLIKSFKIVNDRIKSTVLVIAGEGHLIETLKKLSADLGIADSVIFLGARNDIPELMSICNCFVLSSKHEGFGMVVGEAMAMKKAVVATNCGGVKELMGGYGTLVNVDDVCGFADAMLRTYYSNYTDEELNSMRYHIQSNYSVPLVIDKWTHLYQAIHE